MPNPTEVARVVARGQSYDIWTSIEVERFFGAPVVSQMKLAVAEVTSASATGAWSAIKLKPGDLAQGFLAGQLVISGKVVMRQAVYDASVHGVEITVTSHTQDLVSSTVDGAPGQYKNYTWLQIAQAVAAKVGVNVRLVGNPAGATKIFPRVSEHIGETRFAFIERLARMRDLHLRDDEIGNLVAQRGTSGSSGAQLVEGQNIKAARIVWRDDDAVDQVKVTGAQHGTDQVWGDQARDVAATAKNPNFSGNRPLTILAEQPGDSQDMAMRANHEIAINNTTQVDCEVTVQGWLMAGGSLWMQHVGKTMTVYSPMLIPANAITLAVKGVVHRQSDQSGTTTTIHLCLPNGLGDPNQVSTGPPATNVSPATPDAPDVGAGPG